MPHRYGLTGVLSVLLLLLGQACTATPPPVAAELPGAYIRPSLDAKWIKWPPNEGCAAAPVAETLAPGTLIDRFGPESGSYFSPRSESFAGRALPYICERLPYTVYRVLRPLPVSACKAVAWFDQPGGAQQFHAAETAASLRQRGDIALVLHRDAAGRGTDSPCGYH